MPPGQGLGREYLLVARNGSEDNPQPRDCELVQHSKGSVHDYLFIPLNYSGVFYEV